MVSKIIYLNSRIIIFNFNFQFSGDLSRIVLASSNLKYLLFKSLDACNRHRTRTASIPLLETFYHITRLHHLHVQRYRLFPLFTEPPCFYFTLNACFPPVTRVPYLFSRAVKKKKKEERKKKAPKKSSGKLWNFCAAGIPESARIKN